MPFGWLGIGSSTGKILRPERAPWRLTADAAQIVRNRLLGKSLLRISGRVSDDGYMRIAQSTGAKSFQRRRCGRPPRQVRFERIVQLIEEDRQVAVTLAQRGGQHIFLINELLLL